MNATGASEWANVTATTKSDPLEFAIHGIKGETTCPNQGGQGVNKLFNFDEGDAWHTKWSTAAVPFDLIIDLNSVNQLDKFQYLPRLDAVMVHWARVPYIIVWISLIGTKLALSTGKEVT